MSDNVLTSPWIQQGDLFAYSPVTISVLANTWTKIVDPNPQRMTFTVAVGDGVGDAVISPFQFTTAVTPALLANAEIRQFHASVYPLLIAQAWYIYLSGNADVTVLEVIRRS